MFCDSILGPVKQWGFRNVPVVSHFEGLETHDGFEEEYERNSAEADRWDGSDPYRLVSLP